MSETSKCNRCGAPLPPDSPEGLCPRCLIALNLATQTEMAGEKGTAKPPPAPPLPVADVAKLFPQLEILECLGRGGMGAVYKARQPRLDRLVALKILSPEKQGNQKFAERFEREARALAKLHHPNIVTVYDFGVAAGVPPASEPGFQPGGQNPPDTSGSTTEKSVFPYLIMEFVDGLTLRQLFHTRKLSPEEALTIVPKICEALQYAHEQGIVHRDIKPENILMDKDGHIKIADFGIAKILGDGGRANLTEEQAIGTPHYMSPEQIEKPQSVDHRADIYSLGVVFYEMLTGELPLGKFQPPSKKVRVDVRLDEIVLRALEKEPERRYQRASEVKTQVETVAGSTPKDNLLPPLTSPAKPDHFWRRFALIVLVLIGTPAVIAILGLIVAVAMPDFVHGRAQTLKLSESFHIGQTWFPQGDSIEISSVERTENQMTVKGHYNLVSHDKASLALNFTITNLSVPEDAGEVRPILRGNDDFELTYLQPVTGLPHVSMYDDGHPFASIYFGTKIQADAESKANWITNGVSALAETWSPTLAAGEKPDLQKILQEADDLMNQSHYEESLQRRIWYYNHAYETADPYQHAVRVGSSFIGWAELARRYPKAKQALLEIRNRDTQKILNGEGYFELFQELWNINSQLQDNNATCTLFKSIEKSDPQLAGQTFGIVEGILAQNGDYLTCRKYMGDPQASFLSISNQYRMEMQNQTRWAIQEQKTRQQIDEINRQHGWTNMPAYSPPDTSAMMKKSTEDRFVGQVRQLIEILIGTGSKPDAEDIQTRAVAVLDDPRLKSAVSDAEAKIRERNSAVQSEPADLRDARARLAELRVNYGDQNPEVQKALARIKALEQMTKDEPDASPGLREARAHLAELRVVYGEQNPGVQQALATLKALDPGYVESSASNTLISTNHPQVISVSPPNGATDVDPKQTIRIRFDQPMNPNVINIMWYSGGFLSHGQIHYDPARNEFDIPVQLLSGNTNSLMVAAGGEGFRGANTAPADEFSWQFTTKPFVPKPGATKPNIVKISPEPGGTMSVLTFLEVAFDQPMTLDHGLPYLRDKGMMPSDLPGMVPELSYDSSGQTLIIPLILPPDNETKLTLEGFYNKNGVASDPVVVRCEIGTNNYSHQLLKDISTAAKNPKLEQLLSSMKAARAALTSGTETVNWFLLPQQKGAFTGITTHSATFKWQGTNQYYEDISEIMNSKAFILGGDGATCWLYGNDSYNGPRLNSSPVPSVADIYVSIADPFGLTQQTVQSAIAKGKLVYEGQTQLDGHLCYYITSWYVEQTGNEYWPVSVARTKWWIDSETYLPLQVVQYAPGQQMFKFSYQALNQPLPAAAFQPPAGEGVKSSDWFDKKLGPKEKRYFTIKDGSDGGMSGRFGREGPNGSTSSGLN